jgi:hypothetical protein
MTTIQLVPDLAEQIESLVGVDEASAQTFIENAVRAYIARLHRDKIREENKAFMAQYETLLATYLGRYVAMHQGKVIDHDADLRALHLRVYQRIGRKPALLKKVTNTTLPRELIFRSPRLQRSDGCKQVALKSMPL